MTSGNTEKVPSPLAILQLLNRCSALGMGEEECVQLSRHQRHLSPNQRRK